MPWFKYNYLSNETMEEMMNIEYRQVVPENLDQWGWKILHQYRKKVHEQDRPDEHLEPDEQFEKHLLLPAADHTEKKRYQYQVFEEGNLDRQIGLFRTVEYVEGSESYTGVNEFILSFYIELLKEYRRKGIGRYLLGEIIKIANQKGKKSLIMYADIPDGKAFINAIGSKIVFRDSYSRVLIDEIDWGYIAKLIEEGGRRSPKSELLICTKLPDDIIDDYCEFYAELISQIPDEDMELGDEVRYSAEVHRKYEKEDDQFNRKRVIIVCLEPDDQISGLTEVLYNPSNPDSLMTKLTGVKERYRGHGKGKWIKAKMFEHVRETFPNIKYIQTNNAHSNEPMLAINKMLGFKEAYEMIYGQMATEEIEKSLNI
ncbi:MAG: N-acetyltransferase family protein [Candidatus Kariarchaeaceae archaeon]|jgi:GNAT superfamily N-acetyltransferase